MFNSWAYSIDVVVKIQGLQASGCRFHSWSGSLNFFSWSDWKPFSTGLQ